MTAAGLIEFADALQMASIPASWTIHWPAFEIWNARATCVDSHYCPATDPFDLPGKIENEIADFFELVTCDDLLTLLVRWWHYLVYHIDSAIEDNSNTWPMPDRVRGMPIRTVGLIAILSGTEHARQSWIDAAVPSDIADASLAFVGMRVREIIRKRGVIGIESLSFLRHAVRGELIRLGRLSFRLSTFAWPFELFRRGEEIVALCDGTIAYRRDGLADGTHGQFDAANWTPPPIERNHIIVRGCAIDQMGRASNIPAALPLDEWMPWVRQGTPRIEVHITPGDALTVAACADSYHQAIAFYSSRNVRPVAFTCMSWLLDPALAELLPAQSNIVQFQRPYRLLSIVGDERQAHDLIWDDPNADPVTAPRHTKLHHAIAAYASQGKRLRAVAGILSCDDFR